MAETTRHSWRPTTRRLHRLAWLSLPLLAGDALGSALGEHSDRVATVGAVLAWTGFAVGVVASMVPRSSTLTILRLLAPGAVACSAWAAAGPAGAVSIGAGLVASVVAALLLVAPATADDYVDGSSYGSERRLALKTPIALFLGPIPLAWAAAAMAVTGPPLLAAAGNPAVAVVTAGVGVPVVVVTVRQLHQLSRRWLVFVPAGIVVHDPLNLTEPILFQRHLLDHVGPAPADGDGLDLTGGATGLALELRGREPISVGVRRGRGSFEALQVPALVVTPGRPASALAAAAEHRLPVA